MAFRLSVCIPSFDRPHLLRQAILSCFRQQRRPFEILVSDDAPASQSADIIASLDVPSDVRLIYTKNERNLGQSNNVNQLFRSASGTHISLLHDDDLFCDGGLDILLTALERHSRARCLYGIQQVISPDGEYLEAFTEQWNRRDRRVPDLAGRQTSALRAALWCQPPNDGFIVEASAAKRIGLRSEASVGHAVDADFIIQLAKTAEAGSFEMLPSYVSQYRLTPNSIARSSTINRRQDLFYASLLADPSLKAEAEALEDLLRRTAAGACLDAARAGRRFDAFRILSSRYYDKPYFSRWTAFRLSVMASPALGFHLKRRFDRLKESEDLL